MTERKAAAKSARRTNSVVKQPKIVAEDARMRKKPRYRSFRLHKRVKHPAPSLPSWWGITKKAFRLLRANAKSILYFALIYGLLDLIFVRGFSSPVNVDEIRDSFEGVIDQESTTLATNFTVFSLLVESTISVGGEVSGLYQLLFIVVGVLALIWLFRQQQAGNKVTMKMAFYRGMYPIIPFSLIGLVIALQTVPASIGNFLFTTVLENGLAIGAIEQGVWLLLFLALSLLSFYFISSSLIALLVVTLPEMTPLRALRKAKELVTFRRVSVLRKVLALGLFVAVLFVGIVFPLIFVSASLAQFVFFALIALVIPLVVAYLFVLYRELL